MEPKLLIVLLLNPTQIRLITSHKVSAAFTVTRNADALRHPPPHADELQHCQARLLTAPSELGYALN